MSIIDFPARFDMERSIFNVIGLQCTSGFSKGVVCHTGFAGEGGKCSGKIQRQPILYLGMSHVPTKLLFYTFWMSRDHIIK